MRAYSSKNRILTFRTYQNQLAGEFRARLHHYAASLRVTFDRLEVGSP